MASRPQLGSVIREEVGTLVLSVAVISGAAYLLMRAAEALDPDWILWEMFGGFGGITIGSALLLSVLWRWRI